jgi:hypothetical protein
VEEVREADGEVERVEEVRGEVDGEVDGEVEEVRERRTVMWRG